MRSAMCAMMPRGAAPAGGGAGLPGVEELGIDEFIATFRRESGFRVRIGVYAASVLFAIFPLFTIGVPLPAFLLRGRLLEAYSNRICNHPVYLVRQSVFLVKMMAGLCWGRHERVRALLNLPPYPPDPGTWRAA